MSGTSADGIDAAVVDISSRMRGGIRLLAFDIFPYPKALQKKIIEVATGVPCPVAVLCHLNFCLGERLADAVIRIAQKAGLSLSQIDLVGSHGQTIQHLPLRSGKLKIASTLQIGEPSVIAERTGVTTIADFRPRDMAAGGEGAPLTPYLHARLFSHLKRSRAVINIGGISNVTYLQAGMAMDATVGFDMGPGNMLMDGLVQRLTRGRQQYDRDGKIARRGTVHPALLSEWMRHPFIRKKPPKSTGRELFGDRFITRALERGGQMGIEGPDLVATATALTAAAIHENIQRHLPALPDEVIVGGGGAYNPVLMQQLSDRLHPIPVKTFEMLGHQSRAIEAMTFALLAHETWHHRPANMPAVTGARAPVVLGKIVPGRLPYRKV
jgi:anhydro-N-acetylmuramic acid kinase